MLDPLKRLVRKRAAGVTLTRRLPARFGARALVVSPESHLRYLKPQRAGAGDEMLDNIAAIVRSDSVVWDIGANVGLFALPAAHCAAAGHVVAVEPDPFMASLLSRSRRQNADLADRLDIYPVAVGARSGNVRLRISSMGRASNSIDAAPERAKFGVTVETFVCSMTSLDDMLTTFAAPTIVKVDVEGAELLVLEGARRVLAEVRPVWLVETGDDAQAAASTVFKEHDYALYDASGYARQPRRVERCGFETVAVPAEAPQPG